jgi:hypothetical protein
VASAAVANGVAKFRGFGVLLVCSGDPMNEDNERRFENATQAFYEAERELIAAVQNFVDAQAKAGRNGHGLDILRQLLRKARQEKAKRHRSAYKIVE